MRFQGINPMQFVKATTDTALGEQVGNSMSLNVVERVMKRLLEASQLATNLDDRWLTGEALEDTSYGEYKEHFL
eukprot:8141337-Karenia_brevis.AAC.1